MMRYGFALLVLLAVQFLPGVGTADAQAACTLYASYNKYNCDTREEAYAGALAQAEGVDDSAAKYYCGATATKEGSRARYAPVDTQLGRYIGEWTCSTSPTTWRGTMPYWDFSLTSQCPAGSTWDEASKTCFSAAECLAKPAIDYGGTANLTVANGRRCESACEYTYQGGTVQGITTSGGQTISVGYGGQWKPSGNACTAGDPGTENEGQACITDATSGRAVCINKQGKQCYQLGSMTKQICWEPGETGEKASGSELQKRNVGNTPLTPQTPPADGDTLVQDGVPTTSNTTVNNTTNTTTTTNYFSQGGVDVNPDAPDSGVPSDGSGGGGEGEGEAEYPAGGTDGTTGATAADTSIWKTFSSGDLLGLLDDSGFLPAGAACPAVPVLDFGPLGTFDGNVQGWCTYVDAFGKLLLFMAAISALLILRGS